MYSRLAFSIVATMSKYKYLRPAGMSDEEDEDDDDFFLSKKVRLINTLQSLSQPRQCVALFFNSFIRTSKNTRSRKKMQLKRKRKRQSKSIMCIIMKNVSGKNALWTRVRREIWMWYKNILKVSIVISYCVTILIKLL